MVAGLVAYWLYRRRYGSVRFGEPQTAPTPQWPWRVTGPRRSSMPDHSWSSSPGSHSVAIGCWSPSGLRRSA